MTGGGWWRTPKHMPKDPKHPLNLLVVFRFLFVAARIKQPLKPRPHGGARGDRRGRATVVVSAAFKRIGGCTRAGSRVPCQAGYAATEAAGRPAPALALVVMGG